MLEVLQQVSLFCLISWNSVDNIHIHLAAWTARCLVCFVILAFNQQSSCFTLMQIGSEPHRQNHYIYFITKRRGSSGVGLYVRLN